MVAYCETGIYYKLLITEFLEFFRTITYITLKKTYISLASHLAAYIINLRIPRNVVVYLNYQIRVLFDDLEELP